MTDVRTLGAPDAAGFRRLLRQALEEYPAAFTISVEELDAQPMETLAQAITSPDNHFYGAFDGDQWVGIVNLQRYAREKLRHRAMIASMFVVPEKRGQGIASKLLHQALNDARGWPRLEDVILAVTVGNETARKLYANIGFEGYSIDPRLIKVQNRLYDVEWMIYPLNR